MALRPATAAPHNSSRAADDRGDDADGDEVAAAEVTSIMPRRPQARMLQQWPSQLQQSHNPFTPAEHHTCQLNFLLNQIKAPPSKAAAGARAAASAAAEAAQVKPHKADRDMRKAMLMQIRAAMLPLPSRSNGHNNKPSKAAVLK
jgi:hypothetical protein